MNVIKDKILKQSWKEVLYGIFAIIFCIKLHLLNQELERMSFSNEFELLQYKEYTPVTFFIGISFCYTGCLFSGDKWYRDI